ncbi:MAG: BrnA antitoxin family protein [Nitrososphaera sp.]|nr:BrnA antitoxin family protein [Blastocatellia bacterium]MCI0564541.1 BrnA antitoxin family protein [Nitrososphaera sp.]
MKAKNRSEEFEVEITEAHHEQMIAEGADSDYVLKPGKHKLRRGGPLAGLPPDHIEKKLRVNICLDADIVRFFKERAARPNAAPYQTQINDALRQYIDNEQAGALSLYSGLLEDTAFIDAVAERVRSTLKQK